jgi:hypothetical protein
MFVFAINTHRQTDFLFGVKVAVTKSSVFLCQQLRIWIRSEFWFCVRKIMLQELQNMCSYKASWVVTAGEGQKCQWVLRNLINAKVRLTKREKKDF